jgi:translation initiation factor 3 subunit G
MSPPPPRWGDDVDDSDDEQPIADSTNTNTANTTTLSSSIIPPTHKSRIDSKGIQITTSYKAHPAHSNQLLKTVTKCKVETIKVRECVSIEQRRNTWKPFGQALIDQRAAVKTTVQSKEDIWLEDPHADTDLQDDDPAAALSGNLNQFWMKQQRRQLERKYDVGGATTAEEGAGAAGWTQVGKTALGAVAATTTGKYMTPAQRAGLASGEGLSGAAFQPDRRTDDLNTLRVTNLSENTTEADLQELFQRYGRISRVYLAKDKETMISRGFAFVSFVNKDDAAAAMEELNGHGTSKLC